MIYGKKYKDEASKIIQSLPKLPVKKEPHELMLELEQWMNSILQFSPLIANLIYMRNFMTNGKEIDSLETDL